MDFGETKLIYCSISIKKEVKHEGKEMDKLKSELAKEWKKLGPKAKA
jgi:hypothetical protein